MLLQRSNYGVRKTAVQHSRRILQFSIDGRSGNVTDALSEALGIMREELFYFSKYNNLQQNMTGYKDNRFT